MNTINTPNINSRSDFSPAKISHGPIHQPKPEQLINQELKTTKDPPDSNFSTKYQAAIEWIGSKESIFTSLRDFLSDELPTILAQGTRNIYSFAEAVFQASINITGIFLFPATTSLIGKILGKFFLNTHEQGHYRHYMLFNICDFENNEAFDKAKQRIKEEEIKDSYFMENVFGKTDKNTSLRDKKINSIEKFLQNIAFDNEKSLRLKNFKKAIIFLQGLIESTTWGSLYLLNRLFRKYILGQDRFTGTISYASKVQSDKIGDSQQLTLLQKLGFVTAILSGPFTNWLALKNMDNKNLQEKYPWLKEFLKNWDMSHGLYPKLNLMFSYCLIPQFISCIAGAQGKNELIENLMSIFATAVSWRVGHQATNGRMARDADKILADKFQVERGILIDKRDLHSVLPNPLNVHEIIDKTKDNPELQEAARKDYTKVFSRGFFLNSAISFLSQILINQITKWRVKGQISTV